MLTEAVPWRHRGRPFTPMLLRTAVVIATLTGCSNTADRHATGLNAAVVEVRTVSSSPSSSESTENHVGVADGTVVLADGMGDAQPEFGITEATSFAFSGFDRDGRQCLSLTIGSEDTQACFDPAQSALQLESDGYDVLLALISDDIAEAEISYGDPIVLLNPNLYRYHDRTAFVAMVPNGADVEVSILPRDPWTSVPVETA